MQYNKIEENIGNIEPVVEIVPYNTGYNVSLHRDMQNRELIFEYPTVYLIYDKLGSGRSSNDPKFKVYVGETNDISRRTRQHLKDTGKSRMDWKALNESHNSQMIVIGDYYFNKSLTLDIENKLMMYLLSAESVTQLNNRRSNPQRKYFMSDQFENVFEGVWQTLRKKRPEIFPEKSEIENSAVFKASPFHSLNAEQHESKNEIFGKIESALKESSTERGKTIFIAGQAGTGKTVLLSNLFYDLTNSSLVRKDSVYLLVNHDQQKTVYKTIAHKLGLDHEHKDIVSKPTHFIQKHTGAAKVDVVLVDEAHLLLTQGKMAYRGHNQLEDLLKLAKVVVIVFDKYQILTTEGYLDDMAVRKLEDDAEREGNRIELTHQERMIAEQRTIDWLRNFAIDGRINAIPDDAQYQLKIATSPEKLHAKIKALDRLKNSNGASLARMLATFDWPYVEKRKPKDGDCWRVKIGTWSLPWNLQIPISRQEKRRNKGLAWAEQFQTINEVGSTFTIQGFDLNYAGVIIGPSVKYRDGKLIFDKQASKNKKATNQRTWKHQKIDVSEELLRNELNVLLTRGVHGLYIFAVDEELQQALLRAAGNQHILR
ncbi:DUF2075 domain-containing protein [Lactiplantibacillus plantarum]|uniref:DUF2075 domain-containing protein n=1 Tax=Lactiplantibacillus plantarum TaxID=1590 RepID=UPI00223FD825|nr:DUF2075 domain-containing protein [Lactiplantibacillus plantarum]